MRIFDSYSSSVGENGKKEKIMYFMHNMHLIYSCTCCIVRTIVSSNLIKKVICKTVPALEVLYHSEIPTRN